jgi:hypothetical protein
MVFWPKTCPAEFPKSLEASIESAAGVLISPALSCRPAARFCLSKWVKAFMMGPNDLSSFPQHLAHGFCDYGYK